ncbi:DVU_1557 family redox protein [Desulfogranum mediterraneum]|uniref:DVU_1557 family redox protein n=1 Tax=Desulfogranum mediterraneum TaxID=160661 RepID=UPI0004220F84|nr:CLJU_RS11820 family redox protein [Desulfogranum mediterraneum]
MNLSFLPADMNWRCQSCGATLQPGMVELHYLGNVFRVELPVCPSCSAVLISEELATGRMLEIEQLLEDK